MLAETNQRRPSRESYGLWSLWDMQRFYADKFVSSLNLLSGIKRAIATGKPNIYEDPVLASILRTQVKEFENTLGEMGLKVTKKSAINLLTCLSNPLTQGTGPIEKEAEGSIDSLLDDISARLRDELDGVVFFQIERVDLFEQVDPLFGTAVQAKFPSASPEIEEAGKCLSLRRPTASVMHLMRVLELGLHSLADAFKVPFANANWQTIIDQIEKQIKAMSATTHGADWKSEQQFYSESAAHFRVLKDAWRNHSMHIHERYSEERAETIFQSVRGFMQHLATRLKEPNVGVSA